MDYTAIIVAIIGSGLINTLLTYIIGRRERKKDELSGIKKAMCFMLKDSLKISCMNYIEQGWIYEDELEELIETHKCYHNDLDGNGWLDELMSRVKSLPIKFSKKNQNA